MKPHPFQVLSKFREGSDTLQIATLFEIDEAVAVELLDQARKTKPDWSLPKVTPEVQRRASRKALFASRSKKPVSLAPISFLGGKS
jgi:hypothetical protein